MSPRLEHQRPPNPIVIPHEDLTLFRHRDRRQERTTAGDDANRVAAGVGVNTEEGVTCHITSPRVADKVAISRGGLFGAPYTIALAKGYFYDGLNELKVLGSSGGGPSVRNMLVSGAPSRALRPKCDD
jgi:hypothetical protein